MKITGLFHGDDWSVPYLPGYSEEVGCVSALGEPGHGVAMEVGLAPPQPDS